MRLYLEILEGPLKGQKLTITGKTSIGRKGADIVLNDPKLSGEHAVFEYIDGTGWVVKDLNSRNGVWVNGMKEPKYVISDLDEILIGSSKVQCRLLNVNHFKFSDSFKQWVQSLFKKAENSKISQDEIKPEIRLKVVQGIQYGESWDVFYGPRVAGKDSLDIRIFEETAPEDAFEIRVKGKYAYFYTDHENIVKLNKEAIKEKQFAPGDRISIGESEILVEINEGHGFSR